MTKTFDEVISGIRTAKKGVEVREDLAQMGEYCKQFTEEAGQKANSARDEAKGYATAAKASEKKATDAVAGIEQTKTDAVQAVQNAQRTATNAVQQAQSTATTAVTTKQTEAVQAVGTAQTGAVKAVDDERDAALQQVADSTATAKGYAESAVSAANSAGNAATAAGGYASNAESSATDASGSASAAATSESNAATSAQSAETDADRAEAAAALAGTRANTDKNLKTENAPADAKAVGDIILDAEGNVIFYSKAAVDKLLAGKLDLTGGTMSGPVNFSIADKSHVYPIESTISGDYDNFLRIKNTSYDADLGFGVGLGKHLGIFDYKNGHWIINGETDTDKIFIGGEYFGGAVVASGSNYVRFGDGTQICSDGVTITGTDYLVTFPVPFTSLKAVTMAHNANIGVEVGLAVGYETGSSFRIYTDRSDNTAKGFCSYIAIGRWK